MVSELQKPIEGFDEEDSELDDFVDSLFEDDEDWIHYVELIRNIF